MDRDHHVADILQVVRCNPLNDLESLTYTCAVQFAFAAVKSTIAR